MLNALGAIVPKKFGAYHEPFFGGGALFFHLQPEHGFIADANPELANLYSEVAHHVEDVINALKDYRNSAEDFYAHRAVEWKALAPADAAARTLYLNKTCFNGLYRVNRKGQFNTPFGAYSNPKVDELTDMVASETDDKKRNEMIAEAMKIHQDDIGHIPLHQQALNWASKKNIELLQWPDNGMPWQYIHVK